MIYWKEFNIALFHIPKTGGCSIKEFFNSTFGKKGMLFKTAKLRYHEPLHKKKYLLFLNSLNPFIITNIRNPFEYLISLYCYTQDASFKFGMRLFFKEQILSLILSLNFHEFVEWYVENGLSFKDYLFVDGKLPERLYINKLETVSEDMRKVFKELNIAYKFEIEQNNLSNRKDYICDYTPELEDKVRQKFKWCFENYY